MVRDVPPLSDVLEGGAFPAWTDLRFKPQEPIE
jgi:hypothetical protein